MVQKDWQLLTKSQEHPREVRKNKKLIKNIRKKLRGNPQKSTRKHAQEAHVSCLIMQRVLVAGK